MTGLDPNLSNPSLLCLSCSGEIDRLRDELKKMRNRKLYWQRRSKNSDKVVRRLFDKTKDWMDDSGHIHNDVMDELLALARDEIRIAKDKK